MNWQKFP